jgi:urease accessory protein
MNRRGAKTRSQKQPENRNVALNGHGSLSADSTIQIASAPPRLCGANQWLLWQLADSAFPTGGFAHSAGLEAAWQHGEVRNRVELREWLIASLQQIGRAALPFVNAAHAEPERLHELDRLCDAFTSNHVANHASRLQGRALLAAVGRVFKSEIEPPTFAHLAPVFGAVTHELYVLHLDAVRLFVFMHLRSAVAAAVRLNIVGPMEGQVIQFQLSEQAEAVVKRSLSFTLGDLAQTAPLLEIWQGSQDRLYSRLFQS